MAVDLHPVKRETFNTGNFTNTDPKGYLRQVDTYTETEFGLYMACLLYTSPSPRDLSTSRMPSSA